MRLAQGSDSPTGRIWLTTTELANIWKQALTGLSSGAMLCHRFVCMGAVGHKIRRAAFIMLESHA
jgi:hypothetical protein